MLASDAHTLGALCARTGLGRIKLKMWAIINEFMDPVSTKARTGTPDTEHEIGGWL